MEGNQKKSGKKPVKKTPAKKKRKKTTKKSGTKVLGVWIAVAVLGAVVLFSLLQRPSDLYDEIGAKAHGRAYRYAVDISHHNPGRIVWDSLHVMIDSKGRTTKSINKANDILPVSYVILKASEGITLKDRKFHKHWNMFVMVEQFVDVFQVIG